MVDKRAGDECHQLIVELADKWIDMRWLIDIYDEEVHKRWASTFNPFIHGLDPKVRDFTFEVDTRLIYLEDPVLGPTSLYIHAERRMRVTVQVTLDGYPTFSVADHNALFDKKAVFAERIKQHLNVTIGTGIDVYARAGVYDQRHDLDAQGVAVGITYEGYEQRLRAQILDITEDLFDGLVPGRDFTIAISFRFNALTVEFMLEEHCAGQVDTIAGPVCRRVYTGLGLRGACFNMIRFRADVPGKSLSSPAEHIITVHDNKTVEEKQEGVLVDSWRVD